MKIGILTFHRSRNYGAILQAYGLTKTIKRLGNEIEIIDYACPPIDDSLRLWNKNSNILKSIKQFVFRYQKKRAFDGFTKRKLPLTRKRNISKDRMKKELNKYECIIVGSDQIWNTKITNNDQMYFINLPDLKLKRVAYAGSAGDNIILSSENIKSLKNFNSLSVRETKLQEYLFNFGIDSTVCCDPSLLLRSSDYIKLMSKRLCKKKYIFVFMIWESEKLLSFANLYAKEHGYKVISNKNCFDFFLHCKPEDFLSWIYHAECILTNSFHGTVFSLLFHKNFLSDINRPNGEVNERIKNILETANCNQCILYDLDNIKNIEYKFVDFTEVDKNLDKQRCKSLKWLKQVLEN